jgi:hypothetical protein
VASWLKAWVLALSIALASALIIVGASLVFEAPLIEGEECVHEERGFTMPELPPQAELVPSETTVDFSAPGRTKPSFRTKDEELLPPRKDKVVTASRIEPALDEGGNELSAVLVANAIVIGRGSTVRLSMCAESGDFFDAGSYTGRVELFGRRLQTAEYNFTVTKRAHWVGAMVLLALAAVAYVLGIWRSKLPPGNNTSSGQKVAFALFAIGGFGVAYVTVYLANPTWGAGIAEGDPRDAYALAATGIAGASLGTAWLVRQGGGGGHTQEQQGEAPSDQGPAPPTPPPRPTPPQAAH